MAMTARGVRGEASTEVIWVGALLAAFLAINLLTASLSPTVWMDEVMLADPAINLHLFGRFVSSAWYGWPSVRKTSWNQTAGSRST